MVQNFLLENLSRRQSVEQHKYIQIQIKNSSVIHITGIKGI